MDNLLIKSIRLPASFIVAVDVYRLEKQYRSWNFALLHLIAAGLKANGVPVDVSALDRKWGGNRQK